MHKQPHKINQLNWKSESRVVVANYPKHNFIFLFILAITFSIQIPIDYPFHSLLSL